MSVKIFDAWRVPTQDMSALVALGRTVKGIQSKNRVEEMTLSLLKPFLPYYKKAAKALYEEDPAFSATANALSKPIEEAIGLTRLSSVTVMSCETKGYLSARVAQALNAASLSLPESEMNAIVQLCTKFVELAFKEEQSLVFVLGDNGSTYVKGFGLTAAAKAYMDAHYEGFQYTDQCEMDIRDFDKSVRAAYDKAESEEEKNNILWAAQTARGALWDDAFGTYTRFCDVGLNFSVETHFPHIEIKQMVIAFLKAAMQ